MFEEDIFIGFARTLQDKTAIEGTQTIFECQLDSHTVKLPNLQIKWTRNGNEPVSYLNTRTERLDDGTLRLYIDPVSRNDVGKYKCTVSYEKSTVWTEAKLVVQGFHHLLSLLSHINPIFWIKLNVPISAPLDANAPEFIELLKSATTVIGGTAVLKCRVKGDPRPTIKWTKQGQEIKSSDRSK